MKTTVAVGCDHAGYELKEKLITFLQEKGYEVKDYGTNSDESVDYPDFAKAVAQSIVDGKSSCGVLICGSGNGINITANKIKGIRAALCWRRELARLARMHNDANIVSLPARFINFEEAEKTVETFLTTDFEAGGRHEQRVEKIEGESKPKKQPVK